MLPDDVVGVDEVGGHQAERHEGHQQDGDDQGQDEPRWLRRSRRATVGVRPAHSRASTSTRPGPGSTGAATGAPPPKAGSVVTICCSSATDPASATSANRAW